MSATFAEFVQATGDCLARFELYAEDPHGTGELPPELQLSIELASLFGSQCDVAPRGRTLAIVTVPAWVEILNQYATGALDKRGNRVTVADAIQGYRDVRQAFDIYQLPAVSTRASVAQLKSEGAAHRQIAAIYSVAGEGPFNDENGTVLVGLIDQEAEKPGSVVKDGWEAALLESQMERKIESIRQRIAECEGKPLHADEQEPKRRGRGSKQAVVA